MQRFIPFDDQWDELAGIDPTSLVPYYVGVPCEHALADDYCTLPQSPSTLSASPSFSPSLPATPPFNSRT